MKIMYRKTIIPILLVLVLYSCGQKATDQNKNSLKDSALKEYVQYIDTLMHHDSTFLYFDSTEYTYRLLKAIYENDSVYLKDVRENIASWRLQKQLAVPLKNHHEPILKKIDADEAYQFSYGETFCDFDYNLSISKKKDNINLHAIVYQLKKNEHDSIYAALIKEFDKKISAEDWSRFIDAVEYADYWGLKPYKQEIILDGGSLSVDAIVRSPADGIILKTYSVSRRLGNKGALYNAFTLLLKFADLKNKCNN